MTVLSLQYSNGIYTMHPLFPPIASFEAYENHKLKKDALESAAREVISRHHLPEEQLSILEMLC